MTKYELANWYGTEMRRHGMSYYNQRMNVEDPTPELKGSRDFQALSAEDQNIILRYGDKMRIFGKGVYAERGACAEYYDECHGCPPPNPFRKEENSNSDSESGI